MNKHVDTRVLQARALRRAAEPAEQALWQALRGRRLGGFKFRRQVPMGPHFADFLCHGRAVVVLVEDGVCPSRMGRVRDEYLMGEGYSVFRVPAANVLMDLHGVCDALLAVLEERIEEFVAATPSLPLPVEEGR